MPVPQATPVLTFSPDPLSDTTPTYSVNLTPYFVEAAWTDGKTDDLDEPQAGSAQFLLWSTNPSLGISRLLEPEYKGDLVNLITNPSFETNSTSWAAGGAGVTVARATTQSHIGTASLQLDAPNPGTTSDRAEYQVTLTSGQQYTFSGWIKGVTPGSGQNDRLWVTDSTAANLGQQATVQNGQWQFFQVTFTATANNPHNLRFGRTASGFVYQSFGDQFQLETSLAPTSYCDGSIANCRWSGTAHASTSYRGGPLYPNIVPMRRFKLQWTADGTTYDEGIWYATSYEMIYPDGAKGDLAQVLVTCVDGFGLLSLDNLPHLDPPDATSLSDVMAYDEPSLHYPLSDAAGTKAKAHVRKYKLSIGGGYAPTLIRRKRVRRTETRSEAEGLSGPPGSYRNLPALGQAGIILGDVGTSVLLTSTNQHVRIPLDNGDTTRRNAITIEAWIKTQSGSVDSGNIVWGPLCHTATSISYVTYIISSGAKRFCFDLDLDAAGGFGRTQFLGLTTLSPATIYHTVATWDGVTAKLYLNGVLDASYSAIGEITQGDNDEFVYIGGNPSLSGDPISGYYQQVAVYEYALSPERILAHYQAGAQRGYAAQLAGDRIEAIATSDLWSEANIPTGSFNVLPKMQVGQTALEEILETVRAEMPNNHFYFNGTGDPVYRPWNYADGLGPLTTLGDGAGEVAYTNIEPVYDDDIYNDVTVTADGGLAQTNTDATSDGAYRTRSFSESGLMLQNDYDAESVSASILDQFKDPRWRCAQVDLMGDTGQKRTAIGARVIGDLVRVKRRENDGTPIDIVTPILGRAKRIDINGTLTCTWNLGRGFNAANGVWVLGISGFTELDSTTVLS